VRHGSIPSDQLATYRYLPVGLIDDLEKVPIVPLEGGVSEIQLKGHIYQFDKRGLPIYLEMRSEGKIIRQIFQYYLNADWERLSLPSLRVEIDYTEEENIMSIDIYKIVDAIINQEVNQGLFILPVNQGRLFVDERKELAIPVRVRSDYPDAEKFSKLPEADYLNTKKKKSLSKSSPDRGRSFLLWVLVGASIFLCVQVFFRRKRRSYSEPLIN
jgi:hypothetical protein